MKRQEKLLLPQEGKEGPATNQASCSHTEHKKVGKEAAGGQSDTPPPPSQGLVFLRPDRGDSGQLLYLAGDGQVRGQTLSSCTRGEMRALLGPRNRPSICRADGPGTPSPLHPIPPGGPRADCVRLGWRPLGPWGKQLYERSRRLGSEPCRPPSCSGPWLSHNHTKERTAQDCETGPLEGL